LILDDITLDKPYAQKMELVAHHWSGEHQMMVRDTAFVTLALFLFVAPRLVLTVQMPSVR
jgi:hypothetical protein